MLLLDLVKEIRDLGLDYTMVSLRRIDIPFDNFTAVVVIRDRYDVYILDEGYVIDIEACETVEEVMDFILELDMILEG